MTRAAIYARVSSDAQRKERTIEAQLRDVPAACRAQGWTIVETYVDDGKSAATGKLAKRDAFARLVVDAAAGRFDVVAVIDQDRITRTSDLKERGAILGAFQTAGVKVFIASTGQLLDYRTETGDLLGNLGAWQAAVENAKRLMRTIAGKETTILRGGKPQGETPYGLTYRKGDNKRGIAPEWGIDPHRSRIVREIYTRVANGESTAAIAHDLNRRGERRPRGGIWYDVQVRNVIASPIYCGRMTARRHRDRFVPVPAIVDDDLAAEARAVLRDRYKKPPPRTRHHHLLAGLATCAECGHRIGITAATRRAGRSVYAYRCLGKRQHDNPAHACRLPSMHVAAVDERVWDALMDALATEAVVDRAIGGSTVAVDYGAIERAEAALANIDRLQDAALDQLTRGVISQAVADRQVERLGRERREAIAALEAARTAAAGLRPAVDRAELAEAVRLMRADAEHMGAAQRRELLRAAVGRVAFGADVIAIDLLIETDAGAGCTGRGSFPNNMRPAHRYHAGQLRVATPRRRAA